LDLTLLFFFCVAPAITASGQTFTSLASFDYTNGARPYLASLVQGTDGNFYGTTSVGGANGPYGSVFKITPAGVLTTVHSFDGSADGAFPSAGLLLATDGNSYGTTEVGGSQYAGTIFQMSPAGTFTALYSFCALSSCSDGGQPDAALIQGRDGNFYGTAQIYGANGAGTVFKITPKGALTTLYNFCLQTNCADGAHPNASLIQSTDGNFYGTTFSTIFKITPSGNLTTLHTFTGNDGSNIISGLIQATDGKLYGTASAGGPSNNGTVFVITPSGNFTTLYTFEAAVGIAPEGALVQATDGNLYGTAVEGGIYNSGIIFRITRTGILTTLYSFCAQTNCTDGNQPTGALMQGTNGKLYGTTGYGGASDEGTFFSLSAGLRQFVETIPASAKSGTAVRILGQGLTGATAVSFSGISATFTVRSDTYLTCNVPAGATTGFVTVTTPKGTLKSNIKFRVLP
jgi:uncharacterized repeat protein (TIGR03803 family)